MIAMKYEPQANNVLPRLVLTGVIILAALLVTAGQSKAQAPKFSGYVLSDYYYVATSHDEALEGQNGVWFRRIYFTMDQIVADKWSMRLRTEMGQPGDFESKGLMVPFVKDAYLKWKGEKTEVLLGLSSTPSFAYAESVWGYRSVEKTSLDLYKRFSSRDFGIAVKGKFAADDKGAYHFMVSNGSSTKSEANKGKKVMGSVRYSLLAGFTAEAYGDYEKKSSTTNQIGFSGRLFYVKNAARFGAEFTRIEVQENDVDDRTFDIVSVFGSYKVSDKVSVLGRYDRQFQINPTAEGIPYFPFATADNTNFFIAGVDYTAAENVHFIPNIEAATYSNDEGEAPESDVMLRVTLYYKF